jgi:FdhE protein
VHEQHPLTGALPADVESLLDALPALFDLFASGPAPLAELERARASEPRETARERLLAYWDGTLAYDWITRAALRPYLVVLRSLGIAPVRPLAAAGDAGNSVKPPSCPSCGGAASVASRRTLPDTDGATRFLHCSLCGDEWVINRVRCPSCGEEDPYRLANFQATTLASARIESCETCKRYVKSIDRSTDARRVPEIDDLATIALDLWAIEQGLLRGEPGLLGV